MNKGTAFEDVCKKCEKTVALTGPPGRFRKVRWTICGFCRLRGFRLKDGVLVPPKGETRGLRSAVVHIERRDWVPPTDGRPKSSLWNRGGNRRRGDRQASKPDQGAVAGPVLSGDALRDRHPGEDCDASGRGIPPSDDHHGEGCSVRDTDTSLHSARPAHLDRLGEVTVGGHESDQADDVSCN